MSITATEPIPEGGVRPSRDHDRTSGRAAGAERRAGRRAISVSLLLIGVFAVVSGLWGLLPAPRLVRPPSSRGGRVLVRSAFAGPRSLQPERRPPLPARPRLVAGGAQAPDRSCDLPGAARSGPPPRLGPVPDRTVRPCSSRVASTTEGEPDDHADRSRRSPTCERANKATAARFVEAFNHDDWDTVREVVADGFVFHHPIGGTVEAGPEGMVATWAGFKRLSPDSWHPIPILIAEGDCVAVLLPTYGHFTGRSDQAPPPTGGRLDYGMVNMVRFEAGKLAEMWFGMDPARRAAADGRGAGVSAAPLRSDRARGSRTGPPARDRDQAAVRRGSVRRRGDESRGRGPLVRCGAERSRPGGAGRGRLSNVLVHPTAMPCEVGYVANWSRAVARGTVVRLPGSHGCRRLHGRGRRHRGNPVACAGAHRGVTSWASPRPAAPSTTRASPCTASRPAGSPRSGRRGTPSASSTNWTRGSGVDTTTERLRRGTAVPGPGRHWRCSGHTRRDRIR